MSCDEHFMNGEESKVKFHIWQFYARLQLYRYKLLQADTLRYSLHQYDYSRRVMSSTINSYVCYKRPTRAEKISHVLINVISRHLSWVHALCATAENSSSMNLNARSLPSCPPSLSWRSWTRFMSIQIAQSQAVASALSGATHKCWGDVPLGQSLSFWHDNAWLFQYSVNSFRHLWTKGGHSHLKSWLINVNLM